MSETAFRIAFRGTRGSIPVSGPEYARYGGNTFCVEVHCGEHVLIFDAGSGLPRSGVDLKADSPCKLDIFLGHCHYDHMIGLMYFAPLYDSRNSVTIWSGHLYGKTTTEALISEFVGPPWFPVRPKAFSARIDYRDFPAGEVLQPRPGIRLRTGALNHPGGCIGYRVEWGGRAIAVITDTEHVPGDLDPAVLELIEGTELFLYDACYTDAEMPSRTGFGHSSWEHGIRLARSANVPRVAFIHHAPLRSDDELDALGVAAARDFPGAFFARDGQVIEV